MMKLCWLFVGLGLVIASQAIAADPTSRSWQRFDRTMQRYNERVGQAAQRGWEAGSRYRSNSYAMPQYSSPMFDHAGYTDAFRQHYRDQYRMGISPPAPFPSIQEWSGGQSSYGGYYPYVPGTIGRGIVSGSNASALGGTSSQGKQIFSLSPDVISVNGSRVPKGSTGYYYEGGQIKFVSGEKFEALKELAELSSFEGDLSAAQYAFTLLMGGKVSDQIGPLSLEEPIEELPILSVERQAEVEKNKFNMVKALFDNGRKPTIDELSQFQQLRGELVYRTSPDVLVDVSLVLKTVNNELRAALVRGNENALERGWEFIDGYQDGSASLRENPPSQHPFSPEALYFVGTIPQSKSGVTPMGHRLRKFASSSPRAILWVMEMYIIQESNDPTKKWNTEGYAVPAMTPVAYCLFRDELIQD